VCGPGILPSLSYPEKIARQTNGRCYYALNAGVLDEIFDSGKICDVTIRVRLIRGAYVSNVPSAKPLNQSLNGGKAGVNFVPRDNSVLHHQYVRERSERKEARGLEGARAKRTRWRASEGARAERTRWRCFAAAKAGERGGTSEASAIEVFCCGESRRAKGHARSERDEGESGPVRGLEGGSLGPPEPPHAACVVVHALGYTRARLHTRSVAHDLGCTRARLHKAPPN
jgi:hypothetical protein